MREDVSGPWPEDYLRRRTSESDYIFREAREAGVRLVRCLWADLSNVIRGRAIQVDALRRHLISGVSVPAYVMGLTTNDTRVDLPLPGKVALVPDPSTFKLAPYAPNTAVMLGELFEGDQQPWALCPRSFLKRIVADLSDAGLHAQIGVEIEFYFGMRNNDGTYLPIDDSLYASSLGMQIPVKVINEVAGALADQKVVLEHYHPEAGGGQQELTLSAVDPVTACDRVLLTRETVRALAWAHGWYASFMPKPFESYPGSGLHLHLSLWDRAGNNITALDPAEPAPKAEDAAFDPDDPRWRLSAAYRAFLAGVLRHLPALTAVACPTPGSYRRLHVRPTMLPYATWGYDTLHTLIRQVPLGWSDPRSAANVEFKFADPSANPYLLAGALLAAGLDGVSSRITLPRPVDENTRGSDAAALVEQGIEPLPETLADACDALESDGCLRSALGSPLLEAYLAVKRREAASFENTSAAIEQSRLFWKF